MPPAAVSLVAALADRYRLAHELGVGGMATVYLAHDLRHNRDVAIKVLHADLGAALGADRFLTEIRTTAKLQHPHILPLLDSGSVEDAEHHGPPWLYYVMPLVTGETLRARLQHERQLPIAEAVRIAREIASALDYAHRQGVIHRDIKPENILLHDGQALVADFGISLAVQSAGGPRMTQTGLSLGTPQYMSPEQAMGERTIDARSDVYALGAVTYEMLTGEPPFTGATVQAIVAKVLTERPVPVSTTRETVPAAVEQAVLTALAKLPADRHATAHEFADALQGHGTATSTGERASTSAHRTTTVLVRRWRAASVVFAAVFVVAAALAIRERTKARAVADAAPVIRTHFDLPAGARIADALAGTTIAVSPAGDMIAFTSVTVNGFRMYVRRVNELAAREISDANIAGRNLAFSPDGKWLVFTEGSVLRKVTVDGGATVTLGSTGGAPPYGLMWSRSDTIYIGGFSGMLRMPASGGAATPVPRADSAEARLGQRWPLLLPGGGAILYASGSSSSTASQLAVVELASRRITNHTLQVSVPIGVMGDDLVYVAAGGELMAVRIDVRTGRPLGDPVLLEDGILVDPTAGAKVSLSPSGTIAFMRGRAQLQPVLVSPGTGATTPLLDELRGYSTPRYSPDGRRVAFTVYTATSTDIWIHDEDRHTLTRLTSDGTNIRPEWTPDGKAVLFISNRGERPGIWRQSADGSGSAELLFLPTVEPFEAIVSPDMRWLVYRTAPGLQQPRDILAVPYSGERTVTPVVTGPNTESMPRFSPDGKWLSYQANESGRFEIYVRPFPANAGRVQVSTNGGTEAIWGRDGRTIYYRGPVGEIIKVAVTTGASFSIGARTTVAPSGNYLTDSSHPNWDIAPDGRFLMLKRAGEASQMIVVHNWGRELRAKTGGRR